MAGFEVSTEGRTTPDDLLHKSRPGGLCWLPERLLNITILLTRPFPIVGNYGVTDTGLISFINAAIAASSC